MKNKVRFNDGRVKFPTSTHTTLWVMSKDGLKEEDMTVRNLVQKGLLDCGFEAVYSTTTKRWEFCDDVHKLTLDMKAGWVYWAKVADIPSQDLVVTVPRDEGVLEFDIRIGDSASDSGMYPAWGYSIYPGLAVIAISECNGRRRKQQWSLTCIAPGKHQGYAFPIKFASKGKALEVATELAHINWIELSKGNETEIEKCKEMYRELRGKGM